MRSQTQTGAKNPDWRWSESTKHRRVERFAARGAVMELAAAQHAYSMRGAGAGARRRIGTEGRAVV